jgi:hypothetical protein
MEAVADAARRPEALEPEAVERLVTRDLDRSTGIGKPLSRRARQTQRTLEAYLKAGARPRWMERVAQIDRAIGAERARLEAEYVELARACARDPRGFARRWRARAAAYAPADGDLPGLIRTHNEWYPVERDLPMDPRTRDYVPIGGRSYRRPELGPAWVLETFPPTLPAIR